MTKKPKNWYKKIVTRPVLDVEGYESHEKVCSYIADTYFSADEETIQTGMLRNPRESMYITFYTFFKVGQAKCPAYWLGKDLLTALMQSVLTVKADCLNWKVKTGIFMLPKGIIISPEERSINMIYWHYDADNNYLYWATTDGDAAFCRKFPLNDLEAPIYADSEDINPKVVKGFNEYLHAILIQLLVIMECRPELVEEESQRQVTQVKKGFGKNQTEEFYEPLWIGKNYSYKQVEEESNSEPYWRRGLIQNQEEKLVWIEPVLMMGGD